MAKILEREQALALRVEGTSISDIAAQLRVSKSTVSGWCRDIPLSAQAIQEIAKKSNRKSTNALLAYSESLRTERQERIDLSMNQGAKKLGTLSDRDVYCIGLGLYWGEGYKRGTQEFGFTNSDPAMIQFYLSWLSKCFGIRQSDLILRVSINQIHKDRTGEVERYWSDLTGVPRVQFTKTSLIKSRAKKVYSNRNGHYGTLRVKVRRGTERRREILGALRAAGEFARVTE